MCREIGEILANSLYVTCKKRQPIKRKIRSAKQITAISFDVPRFFFALTVVVRGVVVDVAVSSIVYSV